MSLRVLIVDDERRTLAPLEASLGSSVDDVIVHRVQPGATDQARLGAGYDAIVTWDETYETGGSDLIDRIRDAQDGAVATVVLVDSQNRSPPDAVGSEVDTILRIDPDSTAQYQVVASRIREQLREATLETSVGGESLQLPETLSESEEAILLIEDDVFVDCTEAAVTFLGYESHEAICGRHPAELSPPTQSDGQSSTKKVNDVIRVAYRGGYHRFRWVHRRADGRDVPVIVSLTPIIHEGTQMLYCVWREPPDESTAGSQQVVDPEIADSVTAGSAPIRALVVDEDADAGLAAAIDRSGAGITATTVSTSNDALLALDSGDDIDAVVLSSQLPDDDAKHFLDRVHETHPELPVVRVSSVGDDHSVDFERQPAAETTLVETIRSEVDETRTHRDHETGPQRYRPAFEGLPDPVAFFANHRIAFANEAFEAAVGRNSEELREQSVVETVVHSGDRDRFRQILDDWERGRDEQLRHVVRLRRPDGTVRSYEIAGTTVAITSTEGVLVSFRDVTDRQRKQQKVEFERALSRIVLDGLVDTRTQHELEANVVEGLVHRGHDLAWIGTVDGAALNPRAVGGNREFLAKLDSALGEPGQTAEPFVRAARTGELQYVSDIETLLSAEWRDAALEAGYRSAFAVPLSYHDVSYGVLAVYGREPDLFGERERRLLAQFADAIAVGGHSLELENALATDAVTEARITVDDDAYYLVELVRAGAFDDCDDLRVVGSVPKGDAAVLQYVTARGSVSALRERLTAHPAVTDVSVLAEGDPVRLQVTVTDPVPEGLLAGQGVVVMETAIDSEGATLSIEIPARAELQTVVGALEAEYEGVSVRLSNTHSREARDWEGSCFERADLTDKQLAALQAAHYNGYFERPRQSTATDIADSLGVSHSTFLQHLHRAQEKLFEAHFE